MGGSFSARQICPMGVSCQVPLPGIYGAEEKVMEHNDKPKLLNRLSRIEGQVRGVARMVEEDRYCIDILTQIQAVRAALGRVETEMLKDHLSHCIEAAITGG